MTGSPAPPTDQTLHLRGTARLDGPVPELMAVPETAPQPLTAEDREVLLAALLVAGFDPVHAGGDPGRLPDPPGWEVLIDPRGQLRLCDPDGASMRIVTGAVPAGWYAALLQEARLVLLVSAGSDSSADGVAAHPVGALLPVQVDR
jgi:hypothetical protein